MPSKVYRLTNLDTNEVVEDVVARKAKEIIGASGNIVLNRVACKKDNVFGAWKVEFQQDIRPFTKKDVCAVAVFKQALRSEKGEK